MNTINEALQSYESQFMSPKSPASTKSRSLISPLYLQSDFVNLILSTSIKIHKIMFSLTPMWNQTLNPITNTCTLYLLAQKIHLQRSNHWAYWANMFLNHSFDPIGPNMFWRITDGIPTEGHLIFWPETFWQFSDGLPTR